MQEAWIWSLTGELRPPRAAQHGQKKKTKTKYKKKKKKKKKTSKKISNYFPFASSILQLGLYVVFKLYM